VPWDNLALRYEAIGQFEKALANAAESSRLDPKDTYASQNLADLYERLNRFDEAKAVLDKASAQNANVATAAFTLYDLAFIRRDEAGMQRQVEALKGKPYESIILWFKAQGECALGKTQNARQSYTQAFSVAQHFGMKEFAAALRLSEASCEAELGNVAPARKGAEEALSLSDDRDTRTGAAGILARTGDTARAQKLIDDLAKEFPTDTLLNAVSLPVARAMVALQQGKPTEAVTALEPSLPYELGAGPSGAGYFPMHVRGEAYLKAHAGANAAAEYQKILDHRGIDPTDPLYALARLGLGRANALQGDTAKAKTAYQDFLASWKDADPDVPILKEAKAEYAKLQ
jgi:tetratricopeptide (TPR) repeat protein